jgi:hypothetical protein
MSSEKLLKALLAPASTNSSLVKEDCAIPIAFILAFNASYKPVMLKIIVAAAYLSEYSAYMFS